MSRVAITGASGYVGSAIARRFRSHSWDVVEMGRRAPQPFDLASTNLTINWSGIDALVHCAWDFKPRNWAEVERANIRGSLRLFESAHAAGLRRAVFISSLSCFPGCRSLYGRGKLAVEAEAARLGYAVVRPGLVYGQSPGGITGALEKAVKSLRVIPLIGDGSHPQYPVHEDDLAALIFTLCQLDSAPAQPLSAASSEPIPFRDLLRRIAARHGRNPLFIPVPWQLILAGLKSLEALGLNPPFRSDSLTGFIFQNPSPDFTLAHQFAYFRPFQ